MKRLRWYVLQLLQTSIPVLESASEGNPGTSLIHCITMAKSPNSQVHRRCSCDFHSRSSCTKACIASARLLTVAVRGSRSLMAVCRFSCGSCRDGFWIRAPSCGWSRSLPGTKSAEAPLQLWIIRHLLGGPPTSGWSVDFWMIRSAFEEADVAKNEAMAAGWMIRLDGVRRGRKRRRG